MKALRRILLVPLAFALSAGAAVSGSAHSCRHEPEAGPEWTELRLGVHRLVIFSGELRMTRRQEAYPGEGPYHGKTLTLIETVSGAEAFGGRVSQTETSSWIDPVTGATVEFRELRRRKRLKVQLFRADGYQEQDFRPAKGKDDAPVSDWTVTGDEFVPYRLKDGSALPAGAVVRDYYNMVADLGRLDLSAAGKASYYVATKDRVVRFDIVLKESGSRTLKLDELGTDERVEVPLKLRRLELTPWNEDPSDIGGLFAMEGGTEIWLEEETGIVALIAGKVPRIPGRTELVLRGVRFAGRGLKEAFLEPGAGKPGRRPQDPGTP